MPVSPGIPSYPLALVAKLYHYQERDVAGVASPRCVLGYEVRTLGVISTCENFDLGSRIQRSSLVSSVHGWKTGRSLVPLRPGVTFTQRVIPVPYLVLRAS